MTEYTKDLFKRKYRCNPVYFNLDQIKVFADDVMKFLFPQLNPTKIKSAEDVEVFRKAIKNELCSIIHNLKVETEFQFDRDTICHNFFDSLPTVEEKLEEDATAISDGDPAAINQSEVILCYPGFFATAIYRIAHEFYEMKIPILPRILSEYAHEKTGIDIHPGAKIGRHFCIDHGTGLVIGESCIIGDRVKLYQGVTLGAMSVDKSLKQTKRHPTIEDDCIIYSNTTILGGETQIGKGSIIGGNVWLTASVPNNSRVYYNAKNKS